MKHLDLFSGIGGFALAARWMGWETVQFVEIDEFCQKVLKKNFPNVPIFGDITQFDGTKYKGTIDIITGGFPCQTFSIAGKGEADLTLWKEMFRIIGEVEPPFVLAENVPGIISAKSGMAFKIVCADLEDKGYQIQVLNIPACAVGAPHRRGRIWFVAYRRKLEFGISEPSIISNTESIGSEQSGVTRKRRTGFKNNSSNNGGIVSDTTSKRQSGQGEYEQPVNTTKDKIEKTNYAFASCKPDQWEVEPELGRVANGIPDRLDRLKGLGNAIVPQVAFEIFKAIEKISRNSLEL